MKKRPGIPSPFWVDVVPQETDVKNPWDLVHALMNYQGTITLGYKTTPRKARTNQIPQEGQVILDVREVKHDGLLMSWSVEGFARIKDHTGRYVIEASLGFHPRFGIFGSMIITVHPSWIGVP